METNYLDFGVPISFGWTSQYLDTKTQTRRQWKDSHAAKFLRAYDRAATAGQQLRVPAIDKAYHAGGKQIGWCVINCRPCKQRLWDMNAELMAEGGMCASVAEFVRQYFPLPKSAPSEYDDDLREVWVIQFQFVVLPGVDLEFVPLDDRPLHKMLQARRAAAARDIEIIKQSPRSLWPEFMLKMFPESVIDAEENLDTEPVSNPSVKVKPLQVLTSAASDEHNTPAFLAIAARSVMGGIDLDPMSNAIANETIRAHRIFTKADDGLTKPWLGRVWLNPPFSLADRAVPKLIASYESGDVFEAVLLLKSAVETKRYQLLYDYPFVELNKRVNYTAPGNKNGAPFATVLFYLGTNFIRWREVMSVYGRVHPGARLFRELESDRARWQLVAHLKMFEKLSADGTLTDIQRQAVDNFAIGWQAVDCNCEGCKPTFLEALPAVPTELKHCEKCRGRGCNECDFGWSRETNWEAVSDWYEKGWNPDDLLSWLAQS